MTFLIFRLSLKIILELREKWSVFFCIHFVTKTIFLWLFFFFFFDRMIFRKNKIPENLELDEWTKQDFIYFIKAVVQSRVFSLSKYLEKCSHAEN